MAKVDNSLSLTEIAHRSEVRVSAVSNWRKRHPDFPAPSVVSGQEMFDVPAVAQWLRTRHIPQNRLKAGEAPGTSYGDRFLRNVEGRGTPLARDVGRVAEPDDAGWTEQLWRALDGLRSKHNSSDAREILLGLVYVRLQRTDLWHALVDAAQWPEVWHKLPGLSVPLGENEKPMQVFRDLSSDADSSAYKIVRLIDEIDFGSDRGPESISARLTETILADLERGMGKTGGRFTPPSVAQCLVELLDPGPLDRVYDPFCGSGELLSAAAAYVGRREQPSTKWSVWGQASHDWSLRISAMNLALHGTAADLRRGNALEIDRFPQQRFSHVVANPPFNLRADVPLDGPWQFGIPPAHNANFAWLQHVVSKLTPDGRGAVVMAGGAASTLSTSEAQIRAAMVRTGVVECVISLPARLFTYTAIPTMVWVLRGIEHSALRPETLFIDARQLGETADRSQRQLSTVDIGRIVGEYRRWKDAGAGTEFVGATGFSRAVSHQEIQTNDFVLTPGRYTTPVDGVWNPVETSAQLTVLQNRLEHLRTTAERAEAALDTELSALIAGRRSVAEGRTIQLGTICEVVSGPGSVPRSDPQPSWTPLVLPRNIRSGVIEPEDVDMVPPETADRMARYRLRAGDIVSARAGTLGRYGLVREEQTGWLLGPGCVMLRPNGQGSPEYLNYYLNSPAAQLWLMEHTSGSVIRHVNTRTLRELPVWLPPSAAQARLVEILETFAAAAAIHSEVSATSRTIHDLAVATLMSPGLTAPVNG